MRAPLEPPGANLGAVRKRWAWVAVAVLVVAGGASLLIAPLRRSPGPTLSPPADVWVEVDPTTDEPDADADPALRPGCDTMLAANGLVPVWSGRERGEPALGFEWDANVIDKMRSRLTKQVAFDAVHVRYEATADRETSAGRTWRRYAQVATEVSVVNQPPPLRVPAGSPSGPVVIRSSGSIVLKTDKSVPPNAK